MDTLAKPYTHTIAQILDRPTYTPVLHFQKLNNLAFTPVRETSFSAGLDLFSPYTIAIQPHDQKLIPTHLRFLIPNGYYARLACTSGNCFKKHLSVGAGVIDRDYDGDVGVILQNNYPDRAILIERGNKIAQLILEKIAIPALQEICVAPAPKRQVSFGRRITRTPRKLPLLPKKDLNYEEFL